MRVLLLNQVFYPDHAATAQHAWDLARHLTRHGHEVHAIAHRALYGEKGASLAAYEVVEGVHIHRVGRNFFTKGGIATRLLDFAWFGAAAKMKALTVPRPDVIVSFTTPPFIANAGHGIARLRRAKSVYWVMDLYPDVPAALGVIKEGGLVHRGFEWLNRFALRRSDRVVVLGRCMMERVLSKGIERRGSTDHVRRIGVWSDQGEVKPISREENPYRAEWELGDRFVVMYSGNFGLAHDVETFLEAAEMLRDEDEVRFCFVGGGKKKARVEEFVREKRLSNCVVKPYQPREKLDASLSCADVHLVTVLEGLEGLIVPCKLFGIMAAGRATLYIGSPKSEIARVLDEHGCGELVEQGDAAGLVAKIRGLMDDRSRCAQMGDRARTALSDAYDREKACEQWRELLEDVVGIGDAESETE